MLIHSYEKEDPIAIKVKHPTTDVALADNTVLAFVSDNDEKMNQVFDSLKRRTEETARKKADEPITCVDVSQRLPLRDDLLPTINEWAMHGWDESMKSENLYSERDELRMKYGMISYIARTVIVSKGSRCITYVYIKRGDCVLDLSPCIGVFTAVYIDLCFWRSPVYELGWEKDRLDGFCCIPFISVKLSDLDTEKWLRLFRNYLELSEVTGGTCCRLDYPEDTEKGNSSFDRITKTIVTKDSPVNLPDIAILQEIVLIPFLTEGKEVDDRESKYNNTEGENEMGDVISSETENAITEESAEENVRTIAEDHDGSVLNGDNEKSVTNMGEASMKKEKGKEPNKNIYQLLAEDIISSDLSLQEKNKGLSKLIRIREKKVNIMLVGATGSGKSSTINALFNMEVAKVGVGVDPETASIVCYTLGNLTIWDTPGLGDGADADEAYHDQIIKKLQELDKDGNPLIDLVLVVLDASSKDLGTSYDLLNHVIIPCLGDDKEGRILIGLNQSDVAMKGKHWDAENNIPDEILLDFLKQKAESVRKRIQESTGISVEPIYYCAGYKEDGEEQCKPYNLTKLFYYMIQSIPEDKRIAIVDNINPDEGKWRYDDKEENYKEKSKISILESIGSCMEEGAEIGGEIGESALGIPGRIVGFAIGGACGAVKGLFEGIL